MVFRNGKIRGPNRVFLIFFSLWNLSSNTLSSKSGEKNIFLKKEIAGHDT